MNGLTITVIGDQYMLMQFDASTENRKFKGLKAYYDANNETVKGTKEELNKIGSQISRKEKVEFITLD